MPFIPDGTNENSHENITVRFQLPIINGFVQPADKQKTMSSRVTPAEAMSAIPGARVIDYRNGRIYTEVDQVDGLEYSSSNDKLVLELPPINADEAYGVGEDYHQVIRDLGL